MIALLLLLGACNVDKTWERHFDGPVSVAVLQPDQGGPFVDPVGFVSNSRSGRITPIDLKSGRILTDDASASFLRASYVALGRRRITGDIAAYAPSLDRITLYVADFANDVLVEAPYITGWDTWPVEVTPTATEPVFVDVDGSGDTVTTADLTLRAGYTTTEDWVLTYDGEIWTAEGSRSGPQYLTGTFGEAWHSGYREFELTLTGTATAGDRVEFHTDTGVIEHDVGGAIQALSMSPDQSVLALSVFDRVTALSSLVLFDPAADVVLGTLPLDEGAMPYRMDWSATGDLLYVADAVLPAAWEIVLDAVDPTASAVARLDLPAPLRDLAFLETDVSRRLVLAPDSENVLYIYDLDTNALVDVNTFTLDVDGMEMSSPVMGLAHVPVPVRSLQETEWDARIYRDAVAISLFEGRVVLMDVETGCLLPDSMGPRSYETSSSDYDFSDYGAASDPYMWADEATGKHVTVNACGGIAAEETWTILYNEAEQVWEVDGSLSGPQVGVARNDERYFSDDGAISFIIMDGILPATDGDRYVVTVKDGVLDFDSDFDDDGEKEKTLELPGRPAPYFYDAGPTGGGWDELDRRVFVAVPMTDSDLVIGARLSQGQVEMEWE